FGLGAVDVAAWRGRPKLTPRSDGVPCGYGGGPANHAATVCRGWRMSDTQCMECGHAGDPGHRFCPACGRQARAPRIDWHYLAEQVRHGILNLERGFLYALCNLLLRPGRLIRDYIDGQRARQVKPLTLLLVTAAAVVLVGRLVAAGDVIGSTISAGAGLAGNPELAASPAAQEATPDAGIVGQPQFRARDPAAAAAGGGGPAARLPR